MVVKPSSHVALRRKIGLIWVIGSANAHWATPPFSERCSSLLKGVRFGYWSLINLFSTTLSIQANSRVQSLTVSAKRKPVHSFHRDVTTKSERVIAHVIGSNLLSAPWPRGRGGTTSLRSCVITGNNHMTILHSSLRKYIHIVHDLH